MSGEPYDGAFPGLGRTRPAAGVPDPKPTANQEVHRLDAEAEAFRQVHARGIIEAWEKRGNPVFYESWDEAAVRQHWPELWTRWRNWQQARDRFDALLLNAKLRLGYQGRP